MRQERHKAAWIEEVTNLTLHKYLPGHLDGSQQLGATVLETQSDQILLIFSSRIRWRRSRMSQMLNDVVRLSDILTSIFPDARHPL